MAVTAKRKLVVETDTEAPPPQKRRTETKHTANTAVKRAIITSTTATATVPKASASASAAVDMQPQLDRIARSDKTPFQKRVLTLLCQVPRGQVSTYGLMAKHLGSSARAVGSAMRRNPFAPQVPCHRVVATGGALGGFKGEWPKDGEGITLDEKRMLLREEGVRFDGNGRVVGTPFCGFV